MYSTEETRAMAQDVLDYIHAHPEKHDQRFYSLNADRATGCGTTMCVAGTATWLKYGRGAYDLDAESVGQELLGLDELEAYSLFFEMDNERALQKLKKVVVGESFRHEDYMTVTEDGEVPRLTREARKLLGGIDDDDSE